MERYRFAPREVPEDRGVIFDIKRFATDDGPGIRTTVFLKGCPLACVWCHNPEAIRAGQELMCHPDRCIGCGACTAACPNKAISRMPEINRGRCTACGRCVASCPATALRMVGKAYPLEELLELVLRDRQFYAASGGGVTFSGGEPTVWMEYVGRALRAIKEAGVHTAIQTCGLFDYDRFCRSILPFVDLVMFDLKYIEAAGHRRYTGFDNAAILENFRRLTREAGSRILPRVPLVPGITATPDNLSGIAAFLADQGHRRCDLLPYNPAGIKKRQAIGGRPAHDVPELPLSPEEEKPLRELFAARLAGGIHTAA